MARRKKPHDPAAATEVVLAKAEREAEIARLRAMGATITQDRGGRVVSARLSNVFNLLLARKTITEGHYDAAYRLSLEWAAWKGLDGRPELLAEVVDGGIGCPEIITDRMIAGGRRVKEALSELDPMDRAIITAFMVATVEEDRPMAWRGVMERLGVTVRDRQTEAVVGALESLRAWYEQPRRAAA